MTTIKSEFDRKLTISEPWSKDPNKVALRCDGDHNRLYNRAELLAALGAVPREDFDKAVALSEQRQSALEVAGLDRNRIANDRDAWRARAERAEATLAEAHVTERREEPLADWEHDLLGPRNADGRYWHKQTEQAEAKLAEAEATIERVRDVMNEFYKVRGDWHSWTGANALKASLESALDPKPAFELPTEAGVRFTAAHIGSGSQEVFKTFSSGDEAVYIGQNSEEVFWVAQDVMTDFTDHRLLDGDS